MIVLFFLLFTTTASLVLYNNFHTVDEIGHHEHALWQTMNGKFFYRSFDNHNLFGLHAQPIMLILLPIYFLFPHTLIIIFVQNLGIAISALFIYRYCKEKMSKKESILLLLTYLLLPVFYYSNIRSFSPIGLVFPFIAGTIFFMKKENWNLFYVFFILTLMCKENTPLLLIPLGIYVFFRYDKRVGLKSILLSLAWMVISFKILIPLFQINPSTDYSFISSLYGHLGGSIPEILKTIISNPALPLTYGDITLKMSYFKVLFGSTLYLSLLNIEFLIITLPVLLQNLLSSSPYKYEYVSHYNFILTPLIFSLS